MERLRRVKGTPTAVFLGYINCGHAELYMNNRVGGGGWNAIG